MTVTRGTPATQVDGELSKLFGRDSLYLVLWAVQLVLAAGLTPLITRVLGVGEFGVVATTTAVMQVLAYAGSFGLQTGMQRQFVRPGGRADACKLLTLNILLVIGLTLVAWATIRSSGGFWEREMGLRGHLAELQFSVFWAAVSVVTTAALALLRSQDRLGPFVLVSLVQSVGAEAGSLAMVRWSEPTAWAYLQGRVVAQTLAMVLVLVLVPPRLLLPRDRGLVLDALRFSLPLVPAVLSTFVLSSGDRLVVQAVLGTEEVARYQIAYNIGSLPILLLTVLNSVWWPRFFSLASGELVGVLSASRDALYRLLVPGIAGACLAVPVVLQLWAPESYRPGELTLVTTVVIITAVPFAAQLSVCRGLIARGRTVAPAVATVLGSVFNIGLNLLLVPQLKLLGAALATLGSYCLIHALVLFAAHRAGLRLPTPRRLALALAGTVFFALLATELPDTGWLLAVRGVLVLAALIWFVQVLLDLGGSTRRLPGRLKRLAGTHRLG